MSALEDTLLQQLRSLNVPEPEREYRFAAHLKRRYRFDFCWPDAMLACECEGGVFSGGRHVRGTGYTSDLEKYNLATDLNYRVYRFTSKHIQDWTAATTIQKALKEYGG